jgi:hypothetical protein
MAPKLSKAMNLPFCAKLPDVKRFEKLGDTAFVVIPLPVLQLSLATASCGVHTFGDRAVATPASLSAQPHHIRHNNLRST